MQSSLTYSPLINDRNAVNKVINSTRDIGWDIYNTIMLFIDNHWYKENSIALMLVQENVHPHSKPINKTGQMNTRVKTVAKIYY